MAQGPSLIFDKSSLESLNLDEAVLLDNFYRSAITPLFFVECLADLEKSIKVRSTPEQLVGSLAERTPEGQVCAQVHHTNVLLAELSRQFDLTKMLERPLVAGGKPVALGDVKGMFFQRSPEEDALHRWRHHEFLEIERQFAKEWRRALLQLDHAALVNRNFRFSSQQPRLYTRLGTPARKYFSLAGSRAWHRLPCATSRVPQLPTAPFHPVL